MDRARLTTPVVAYLAMTFTGAAAAIAQVTVLGKQIYDLTGSKLDLGLLGLVEFLPAAVLVLVTGAVADRFDRRKVGALGFAGQVVAALALSWYAGTNPRSVSPMFLLVVVTGVARAFTAPAVRAMPPDIVPADDLPWLVPRNSAAWQAALIVGPVLGGLLYTVDVRWPYFAVAALLAIAALSLLAIRLPARGAPVETVVVDSALADGALAEAAVEPVIGHAGAAPETRAGLHDALEGLRFIRGHPVLLGAISLDLFAVLFGGAVALLPAIAKDRLGVGAVAFGWLRAAGGIGAAITTLALAVRPVRRQVGRTLLTVVAVFGAFTIVLGLTHSYAAAFVALAVLSGADAVSVFIRATLVPLVTPTDKRGRVMAVENVFIGASNELGAFESGVAGALLGTAPAVVLGGAATLAIAAGWWVLFPDLRDVDRFPGA